MSSPDPTHSNSRLAAVHLLALAVAADRTVHPAEQSEYESALAELYDDADAALAASREAFMAAAGTTLHALPEAVARHARHVEPKSREWVFRLVGRVVAADGVVVDIEDSVLTLIADAFELSEEARIECLRKAVEDDLGFADRPL